MKFVKAEPKFDSGYIWFVETEYPIPKIGFWTAWNRTLYTDTACVRNYEEFNGVRFGEQIIPPDTQTNEIE